MHVYIINDDCLSVLIILYVIKLTKIIDLSIVQKF